MVRCRCAFKSLDPTVFLGTLKLPFEVVLCPIGHFSPGIQNPHSPVPNQFRKLGSGRAHGFYRIYNRLLQFGPSERNFIVDRLDAFFRVVLHAIDDATYSISFHQVRSIWSKQSTQFVGRFGRTEPSIIVVGQPASRAFGHARRRQADLVPRRLSPQTRFPHRSAKQTPKSQQRRTARGPCV